MNQASFASLFKSYGRARALQQGRCLHSHLCEISPHLSPYLGNFLIEMYGLCGCAEEACSVFRGLVSPNLISWNILIKAYADNGYVSMACHTFHAMPCPDVVTWNTIISALHHHGHAAMAVQMYRDMILRCLIPDKVSFISVLNACASVGSVNEGQRLHAIILHNGFEKDVIIGTAIVSFYGKCNFLDLAMFVFNRFDRDIVSWNAVISSFANNGHERRALKLFHSMTGEGFKPNRVTFICAIGACSNLASRQDVMDNEVCKEGAIIHALVLEEQLEKDVGVSTSLLTMYGKCRNLISAMSTFDAMPRKNVVSWNAMMDTFLENGKSHETLMLSGQMLCENDVQPDKITFLCALDACSNLGLLKECQKVHLIIIDNGYDENVEVGNKVISTYGRCGSLNDAQFVFDKLCPRDIISWNAMIFAHAQNGHLEAAYDLFSRMNEQDIASWNTLISAFTENGLGIKALGLFQELYSDRLEPNEVTFLCVLNACSSLADLGGGELIHEALVCASYDEIDVLTNALVNMYGKCGSLCNALVMFNRKAYKDVVSWNAVIGAAALNGYGKLALELFDQMIVEGKKPNSITFICLLFACNFAGCLDEGNHVFVTMGEFGIKHSFDHHACLIDLLGRVGLMDEAEGLIDLMPFVYVDVAWVCILGACNIHNDIDRGIKAANHCFQTNPEHCSPYVILSNMYASVGEWQDVDSSIVSTF